mgnify:CR=1 FL=1
MTASSEEDAEHYAALDDGCVEFTARLVPEDPNGDEYSVASTPVSYTHLTLPTILLV